MFDWWNVISSLTRVHDWAQILSVVFLALSVSSFFLTLKTSLRIAVLKIQGPETVVAQTVVAPVEQAVAPMAVDTTPPVPVDSGGLPGKLAEFPLRHLPGDLIHHRQAPAQVLGKRGQFATESGVGRCHVYARWAAAGATARASAAKPRIILRDFIKITPQTYVFAC